MPSAGVCSGSEVVPFFHLQGVAVDPEGGVWLYSQQPSEEGTVARFNDAPSNEFVLQWNEGHETTPGFAVDSADNVYVLKGGASVEKFNGTGTELGAVNSSRAVAARLPSMPPTISTSTRKPRSRSTVPLLNRSPHRS